MGPILFTADICPDVSRHPVETLRPKLKWGGKEKVMALKGANFVEADVDASEFAMGENVVTLSLETAEGKVLATDKIDFTRTAPDTTPRKTAFDAHKRLLVDGRVTYPLGIYWHYGNNGDGTQWGQTQWGQTHLAVMGTDPPGRLANLKKSLGYL